MFLGIDVVGFTEDLAYPTCCWFGAFLLGLLALVSAHTGRRRGIRSRMVSGLAEGTLAMIWLAVQSVPWANVIASLTWQRRGDEEGAAKALEHMAVAERQGALCGMIFFLGTASVMAVSGLMSLSRARHGLAGGDRAVGWTGLWVAVTYGALGVLCMTGFIRS